MSPDSEPQGGVLYRLRRAEATIQQLQEAIDRDGVTLARLDEQVGGERGLSAALNALSEEVAGLRKAAWGLAAIIVTAAIGFGFGVLTLIPA